ncbi:hypothetical protein Pla110_10240 [Polystyrenella longa]|uniref:Leucine Rich repeats (2 copies) n=1 Tax=Polystyrenella longa TaxID=2528007 RepID=A0A518CJB0_9PLAN|nr:hypothetical protein [Polystyrenella longa]QDU79316.1 hypothetical protein Pla110_10240 [Polystyrenella longa]
MSWLKRKRVLIGITLVVGLVIGGLSIYFIRLMDRRESFQNQAGVLAQLDSRSMLPKWLANMMGDWQPPFLISQRVTRLHVTSLDQLQQAMELYSIRDIEDLSISPPDSSVPIESDLEFLDEMPALTTMVLYNIRPTHLGIERIGSLSSLWALEMPEVEHLTPADFDQLAKLKSLTSFTFTGNIDEEELWRLVCKSPQLAVARRVDRSPFSLVLTDEHLALLQERISLSKLPCRKLAITDKGVKQIARFSNLSYLDLTGCDVTDAAVEHLSTMIYLRELYIADTQISEEGIATLKEALPKCDISTEANPLEKNPIDNVDGAP